MNKDKLVAIAKILGPQGLKGHIKIRFFGEDPSILEHQEGVLIDGSKTRYKLRIVRPHKKDLICEIHDIADRNASEAISKKIISIEREKLPSIHKDDGAFYITDLVSLNVKDTHGNDMGTIKMIDNFGASDLLLIKLPNGKEFYLPFTRENVPDINMNNGMITIENAEMFLDTNAPTKDGSKRDSPE